MDVCENLLNVTRDWSQTWLMDGSLLSSVVYLHGDLLVPSLRVLIQVIELVHFQDLVSDRTLHFSEKETLLLFYKMGRDISL